MGASAFKKGIWFLVFLLLIPSCLKKAKEPSPQASDSNTAGTSKGPFSLTDFAYAPCGPGTCRTILDLYVPKSSKPVPLVLFFHGGGFIQGDKNELQSDKILGAAIKSLADQGLIAYASANYRLAVDTPYTDPSKHAPWIQDALRAIQYVRSRASDWNIDKSRIALAGGSAGSVIAEISGFIEDQANSEAPDLVARESTRVSAILTVDAQHTADLSILYQVLPSEIWTTPEYALSRSALWAVYGVTSPTFSLSGPIPEPYRSLFTKMDVGSYADPGDPPLWIASSVTSGLPTTSGAYPKELFFALWLHAPQFTQRFITQTLTPQTMNYSFFALESVSGSLETQQAAAAKEAADYLREKLLF